jgi:hypothetical protein
MAAAKKACGVVVETMEDMQRCQVELGTAYPFENCLYSLR